MYEDDRRRRKPDARIRLDSYESALIDALVAYTGMERATLMRNMIMREAVALVGVEDTTQRLDRRAG